MARKKRSLKLESLLWLVLFASGAALALYFAFYRKWEEREAKRAADIRYEAFGVEVPAGYAIHGIDVSSYQGPVHWPSVKAMRTADIQLAFAFVKATEGLNDTDKKFRLNWEKTKAAGLTRGAYHFFLATKSGKQQALQFIKQVHLTKGDLPPVIDIEQLYGVKPALMRARVKEWLETVEAYYRVKPIIYTYADFYERHLGKDFDAYPLWVAHYFQPDKPRVGRSWNFWQYTEAGQVNGIRSKVDCNLFNGDSTDFAAIQMR